MKIKRILLGVAMASLALSVTSCQETPKEKKGFQGEETTELSGITFHFSLPGQDPHIVDVRALQDNPEWAIEALWMYEFDKDGNTIVEEPINIRDTPEFTYSGTEAKFTYDNKHWSKNEVRQFYFVANHNPELKKGDTMVEFKKKMQNVMDGKSETLLNKKDMFTLTKGTAITVTDDNGWRIPMFAHATQGGSSEHKINVYSSAPVTVKLERTIARIDLINHIPELEILAVGLANTTKQANVFKGTTPQDAERVKGLIAPFTAITSSNSKGQRGAGTHIKKLFYLHETDNVNAKDEDVTFVSIKAKHTPKTGAATTKLYNIPFRKKTGAKDKVDVKRNHLYKIIIGQDTNEPSGKVTFKLEEEDWNTIDLSEVINYD